MPDRLKKRARYLAYFTVGYNVIEGVIAIFLGLEKDSISLAGFGGDSFIEVGSALLVLWRLRAEFDSKEGLSAQRERLATIGIGILFLALVVVTVAASIWQLFRHVSPQTTVPGTVIAVISLSFMFWLWRAKTNVAVKLESKTLISDARCSLACAKLSLVLLLGSGVYVLFPSIWWADPVAALVLCCFVAKEGFEIMQSARHPESGEGRGCC